MDLTARHRDRALRPFELMSCETATESSSTPTCDTPASSILPRSGVEMDILHIKSSERKRERAVLPIENSNMEKGAIRRLFPAYRSSISVTLL